MNETRTNTLKMYYKYNYIIHVVVRALTKCWPVYRRAARKRYHSWSESPVCAWCPTAQREASGPPGRWIWVTPCEPGLWCWSPTLTASNTWTLGSSRPSFPRFFSRSPTWFLCRVQVFYMFNNISPTPPPTPPSPNKI